MPGICGGSEDSEAKRVKMLESLDCHTQKVCTVKILFTLVYTNEQIISKSIVYSTLEKTLRYTFTLSLVQFLSSEWVLRRRDQKAMDCQLDRNSGWPVLIVFQGLIFQEISKCKSIMLVADPSYKRQETSW